MVSRLPKRRAIALTPRQRGRVTTLTRPRAALGGVALCFVLLAGACSGDASDPAELAKVTFATNSPASVPQFPVAIQQGFWEQNGLDVDIILNITGPQNLDALYGGQADFALIAETPGAASALQGADLAVIADIVHYTGHWIITRKDAGIETIEDLEGKRIGLPFGTTMTYLLGLILDRAGLSSDDVTAVNIGLPTLASAISSGDVDAVLAFDTFYMPIEAALGDQFSYFTFPGFIVHFLIATTPSYIEENRANVESFLQGLIDANDFVLSNSAEAQADVVEWAEGTVTAEYVAAAFSYYEYGPGQPFQLTEDLVEQMVLEGQWLIDSQDLPGEATPEVMRSVLYGEPLEAISPGSVRLNN